jgi:hypothetical protein
VVALVAGAGDHSWAGLIDATVDVSANYPNVGTIYSDPGSRVVSNGIEYAAGSFANYNPTWQVDINDTQLILTNAEGGGFPFASASFNGFVLKVLNGPTILTATVDSSSGFSPISVSVVNGNEVDINYAGVTGSGTVVSSIIDFTFAPSVVPEPSSFVLVSLSAAMALGYAWRRRAKATD